jgi:hypothetical protein
MKRPYKRRRKRGPVQSKKVSYDGINFASGLERYMYTKDAAMVKVITKIVAASVYYL